MNTHSPELCYASIFTLTLIWFVTTRCFSDFFKKDYWKDRFTIMYNIIMFTVVAASIITTYILHYR